MGNQSRRWCMFCLRPKSHHGDEEPWWWVWIEPGHWSVVLLAQLPSRCCQSEVVCAFASVMTSTQPPANGSTFILLCPPKVQIRIWVKGWEARSYSQPDTWDGDSSHNAAPQLGGSTLHPDFTLSQHTYYLVQCRHHPVGYVGVPPPS